MLARLFAYKLLKKELTWEQIPVKLREQVASILINEFDRPDLISENQ